MSPHIAITRALVEGIGRVRANARWLLVAWAASLALALPLGAAMASILGESLGSSAAAENMRDGFDDLWYQGFAAQARGLAGTFDPTVTGVGAVLGALERLASGQLLELHPLLVAPGVLYALTWTFLSAGFVARYAAGRSDEAMPFLAGAIRFFPRFLALAALAAIFYAMILGFVLPAAAKGVAEVTRETIDERVHFAWTVAQYTGVWMLVWLVAVITDYAKAISVLRPGSLRTTLPVAARLVLRHGRATFGLSASLGFVGLVLMVLYGVLAPDATGGSWFGIIVAFGIGQAYLLLRMALRCTFYAAQTRLCTTLLAGTETTTQDPGRESIDQGPYTSP
jgi:hypothetical protein